MSSDLAFFVDLETKVWQALVDGDAEADETYLSSDFLGVYPSGFAERGDHVGQLANGPTVATYALTQARLMPVCSDAVMLSYRADFVRPAQPATITWYVSSLWSQRNGSWVNIFSQDTPAG